MNFARLQRLVMVNTRTASNKTLVGRRWQRKRHKRLTLEVRLPVVRVGQLQRMLVFGTQGHVIKGLIFRQQERKNLVGN